MQMVIEHINSLGQGFTGFALTMLVQSSVVIVILLGLNFLLRNKVRAIFRYGLFRGCSIDTGITQPCSVRYEA